MGNKMKRSKHDKVVAGVCGGIAEYLNIDSTIIRLGFVFATFFGGIGPIAYIIAIFVMPENAGYIPKGFYDDDKNMNAEDNMDEYDVDKDFTNVMGDDMTSIEHNPGKSSTFVGISLILLGVIILIKRFIPDFKDIMPIFLVIIGLLIVFRSRRK
ncbi:MAG: PspC domain-containing protein [Clostridiaceae bacterium]|mgnify:CR=1 FL=1|nr:PspC domain-containing protein [Clostridiaceae bacterium]